MKLEWSRKSTALLSCSPWWDVCTKLVPLPSSLRCTDPRCLQCSNGDAEAQRTRPGTLPPRPLMHGEGYLRRKKESSAGSLPTLEDTDGWGETKPDRVQWSQKPSGNNCPTDDQRRKMRFLNGGVMWDWGGHFLTHRSQSRKTKQRTRHKQ